MGPAATYGLSMAFDQRRTSGAPVRFTYLGAVLGVLGLTAVLVFGSSLQHLAASPRLQGWDWDFAVTDNTTTACGRTDPGLAQIDGVADIAGLCEADIPVDGRPVAAWGFSPIRGSIEPAIVAGRAPSGPNEVALGSITLHALGKKIGDDVELGVQLEGSEPGTEIRYVIVGETVIPTYDNSGPLADVAALTEPGFDQVIDESSNGDRLLVGTYAPGADTTRVTRQVGALGLTGLATAVEIQRIREVNWLPLALGTLLAGLATLAVGHALVTSVHRRRHDIAMLKALGFDRRQIRAAITWQATTLVGVALAVGIPSGLFVGRAVWRTVATDLGVRSSAPLPTVAPGLIVPVALLVAYLGGRVLSRQAVQSRPAVVLRTD
jgi:hypothetical protein